MKFSLLDNTNKIEILDFLYQKDNIKYLFLISDIEQYGLEAPFIKVYAKRNNLISKEFDVILMKFYSNLLVYYKENSEVDLQQIYSIIVENNIQNVIFTKPFYDIFNKLNSNYSLNFNIHLEKITSLKKEDFYLINEHDVLTNSAKEIEISDIEKIVESRKKISEMANLALQNTDINYLKNSFNKGNYFGFIKYDDDGFQVISHASVSAKNKTIAMVGGVFTLLDYRKKGHAKECVIALCDYLFKKSLLPVLFFDNPLAANMYYKIGFKDYGDLFVAEKKL